MTIHYTERACEVPPSLRRIRCTRSHDEGKKGVSSLTINARPAAIGIAIPCHLGARRDLGELVDIRVCPLRPTSAKWLPQNLWVQATSMITCRLSPMLASLMTRLPQPVLPVLAHRWFAMALCGKARVMTDLLQRIQDRLVGILSCYQCASCRCGCDHRARR